MQPVTSGHWSVVINIIVQKYFAGLTTTCILQPQNFDFMLKSSLENQAVVLQINPANWNTAFENNIYNYSRREIFDNKNNVYYDQLVKKLIAAIEHSHCEGFLAFQDDITKFAEAFAKAHVYSKWRSTNNRFLFAYSKERSVRKYFKYSLFKNLSEILIVEADYKNSSIFYLKTNKFVGRRNEHPESLILLSTFYAHNETFVPDTHLFPPNKLLNLQGREIVLAAFDYRPYVAVDFHRSPLYYDLAGDNPTHLVHVDGAEVRTFHIFCELYNCTLQVDTTEKEEWGFVYSNYTSSGMIGMLVDGKAHVALGAMYLIHSFYGVTDMTTYMGRAGVTCLVPAASRMASWDMPLRPFEFTLWLAVMACLSVEIIVLFAVRQFENSLIQPHQQRQGTWWSSWKFGCTTTLRLFVNQSTQYLIPSHTVRTFLFACYVFDLILTSIYGGGLSTVLTLPRFGESADSVERLAKYNLPWTGTSYAWIESISESEEPIYKRLINNFVVNSVEEMRWKAKTFNMAFIIERMAFGHFGGGNFLTPQALQRLKLMVDDIYSQFTVAMVSRLWPHMEKYNQLLLRWHSAGLDQFWEWKSVAEYLNITQQNQVQASMYKTFDNAPAKLNLQNFSGLIILWMVGLMLSLAVFLFEIIWFNWSANETY